MHERTHVLGVSPGMTESQCNAIAKKFAAFMDCCPEAVLVVPGLVSVHECDCDAEPARAKAGKKKKKDDEAG